jgi:predicted AAA+ superfamily ATPase
LKLIEIHREDIDTLPDLMALLRADPHRFVVFCDDLSFDGDDTSYKSLKAVLEGRPRGKARERRLLRDLEPAPPAAARHDGERALDGDQSRRSVEEKVSLSDRFGLWLGFHKCSQDEYLEMVFGYANHLGLDEDKAVIRAEALEWATTRGSRSGRTAWQYIQDLAGRLGKQIA